MLLSKIITLLMASGWRANWTRSIYFSSPKTLDGELQLLGQGQGRLVDVRLGPEWFRTKQHSLPRNARKEAERLLQLKLEASGLNRPGEIMTAIRRTGAAPAGDIYTQVLARTSDVDAVSNAIALRNFRLHKVIADTTAGDIVLIDHSAKTDRVIWYWWSFAGLAASAFAVAVLFQQAKARYHMESKLSEIEGLTSSILQEAQDARQVLTATQSSAASLIALTNQLEQGRSSGEMLLSFSGQLPKNAWITSLSINQQTVYVELLTTGEPLELISVIENMSFAANVELQRPIDTNPSDGLSSLSIAIIR